MRVRDARYNFASVEKRSHHKVVGRPHEYTHTHYVHVIRDDRSQIKEACRYYFDDHHRPVLDGERTIRRWEHDPGLIIWYREGREIYRSPVIVTG